MVELRIEINRNLALQQRPIYKRCLSCLRIKTARFRLREKYQLSLADEVLRSMLEVRREYLHGALNAGKDESDR